MTEDELRAVTIGEPTPLAAKIADYDPSWPALFEREAARIRAALGVRTLLLEHVGSTSVPGLPAKRRDRPCCCAHRRRYLAEAPPDRWQRGQGCAEVDPT